MQHRDSILQQRHDSTSPQAICPPGTAALSGGVQGGQAWSSGRAIEVRNLRERFRMTREDFASAFGLPLNTVRDWEQGKKKPDSAASVLLKVIAIDPKAVRKAVGV